MAFPVEHPEVKKKDGKNANKKGAEEDDFAVVHGGAKVEKKHLRPVELSSGQGLVLGSGCQFD